VLAGASSGGVVPQSTLLDALLGIIFSLQRCQKETKGPQPGAKQGGICTHCTHTIQNVRKQRATVSPQQAPSTGWLFWVEISVKLNK